MKCSKCEKEMSDSSQFCSNCGEKVELDFGPDKIEALAMTCSKAWYVLGYFRATSTKEEIENYENNLKKGNPALIEWYNEVVDHLKEWIKENNEKNRKLERSKRNNIQKTERVKT